MDQLVIWENCLVGKDKIAEFEKHFADEGFSVKYQCEYKTLPTPGEPDTGNRNDVIFTIQDKDIPKFSLWRMGYGMRWWEDYLDSGGKSITPQEIIDKYPYGWRKK